MQAYKFNAINDDEALKAIHFFKELGFIQAFDISKIGNVPHHIFAGKGAITWLHNDLKLYKNHEYKEVTLPELHSMFILKRNNPADATHEGGYPYIQLFDGWYYFDRGSTNKWQRSIAKQAFYDSLKPIQQKKEYLVPQIAGGFMYRKAYDQRHIPKHWIEIPEGATFATGKDKLTFRKDLYYLEDAQPIGSDDTPYWRHTDITLKRAKEMKSLTIAWVREEPSMNDIIKTAEDHRQSLSDEKENDIPLTDFGIDFSSVSTDTIYHYYACPHNPSWPPVDGIILFDGRISGAEDYNRLRNMIAEVINRKPEDFAIRSLTIVG